MDIAISLMNLKPTAVEFCDGDVRSSLLFSASTFSSNGQWKYVELWARFDKGFAPVNLLVGDLKSLIQFTGIAQMANLCG
jgi:hypothetical protein